MYLPSLIAQNFRMFGNDTDELKIEFNKGVFLCNPFYMIRNELPSSKLRGIKKEVQVS